MNNPKCPICGGQKSTQISENQYHCEYCGNTFTYVSQTNYQQPQQDLQSLFGAPPSTEGKSRVTTAILALLLGGIGIHHFYLGSTLKGVVYLALCWTGIPAIIGFVEGIMLLMQSDAEFAIKPKLIF